MANKKKFPTAREFFVGLCNAVSGVCKKLVLDKAFNWFKDLGEAAIRGMSVIAIRAARAAGIVAKDASADVSKAKRPGEPSRSV